MDGVEAEIYEYDCFLDNSKLQVLLRSLIHVAESDTVFKVLKITVIRQNKNELLNKINFQTNLSIDELAYYFSLTLSEIGYATTTRASQKYNKWMQWMSLERNSKRFSTFKSMLEIHDFYKQFNETNIIDLINFERAFFCNREISYVIYQNYFKKMFVGIREFNLNEFLVKCNLVQIGISDFESVLRKIGELFTRIVIDNYDILIKVEFYVREKINLILVIITLLCPNIIDIIIDGVMYNKPELPTVPTLYLNQELGVSISLYFQADEIERFLYQLYDKTDLLFSVKKVSNIRIKCDSKSVKKMLTLNLYSMRYKFINFLTDHFQSTYQTNDFINFQFAFPWHSEHYNAWKSITIHKTKYSLQYFFNQTEIKSYFNLFDLITIETAFYDLNLDFSYYPYLALKDQIIHTQNGNELNLNDIVKRFKLQTIRFQDFLKILQIYGKFVERFIGSEYLVEVPEFQRNKLKKILFHIFKYCKNCHTIIVDGINLKNLVKKFKMLKINDGSNKIFNYELSNKCNKSVTEIGAMLDKYEIFIEEINIRNYKNFNEFLFLKILQLPFVSKLTLNTYYRNFLNWDFLLNDLKICKFSIQPNYLVKLYNNTHVDSLAGQFITKFVNFLIKNNFHKFIKLQLFCYDCVFDNLQIFNCNLISEVGFSRTIFSYQHIIELSCCKNLQVITFSDCPLLNDDLLLKLAIALEEWGRHVEIKVENCFITDVFFYRFAEHQICKRNIVNYNFYGDAFTKFEFINCHISIDWANSHFVLNEFGDYMYIAKSENDNILEMLDTCDYDFYN